MALAGAARAAARAAGRAGGARRGLALNNPERFELLGEAGGGGEAPLRVSGFGPGGFQVGGARVEGAVVLCGGRLFRWRVRGHAEVGPGSLGVVGVLRPKADILVVGSGRNTVRPSEALRAFAREQGCSLEVQATAAAVSTYNVLSQEGREVVAALLPEDAESGPSSFGNFFPL